MEDFIFPRNDLYFNDEQIENLINFAKEFYFELDDFQKFLSAFLFLYYKEDNDIFMTNFLLWVVGVGKMDLYLFGLIFLK